MQERFTLDVLLNDDTMTNRRMFYALHKLLESVGVAVDRTPGIPIPKKLSDALYHGCDSNLEVSKALLKRISSLVLLSVFRTSYQKL